MVRSLPVDYRLGLAVVLGFMAIGPGDTGAQVSRLSQIELPEGFSIGNFAEGVTGARSLAQSPGGTVFVGTRQAGLVHALVDADGDGAADERYQIASGLNSPNGVAFRNGSLYVAEISRILRYDGIENRLDSPPQPFVVTDRLPTDTHHGWKFIRFGPDGRLYVPVGAPCNICNEADPYNAILRMDADSGTYEIVARGVRNTVGFDWHPGTRRLWFTDNGRDWLGNDTPPDELNVLTSNGQHSDTPFAMVEMCAIRSSARFVPVPSSGLRPRNSDRTLRLWACASTPERTSRSATAARSSWPSMAPGIATIRSATG